MSYPSQFVDSLDALVRLCAARPEAFHEQQELLGVAARAITAGEVTVISGPTWPLLNGAQMDGAATAPDGLVSRLWGRGFQRLFVARDAEAADLLLLARALAGVATGEQDGAELQLRTVRILPVVKDGAGVAPRPPVGSFTASLPTGQSPFEPAVLDLASTTDMPAIALETVVGQDEVSESQQRFAPMINTPILLRTIVDHDKRDLPVNDLLNLLSGLDRLAGWQRVPELSLILEEMGRRAEGALRDDDAPLLLRICLAVLRGADAETHPEGQLAYRQARRRLLARPYLQVVARMLPRHPASRDDLVYLLFQAGEEAADAVITELIEAKSPSDRSAYIATLVRLKAGGRTLLHMLTDERWFVVRNAADLLGEMQVKGAEEPLRDALRHDDERVRYSALSALGRLGTPGALHFVQGALASEHVAMRIQAASVLASSDWPYTVTAVRRRLREEEDPAVELALVAALGQVGSEEAVSVLAGLVIPEPLSTLLRRPTPLRTAALKSLVDAGTPAARTIVEKLSGNRSSELRAEARLAMKTWSDN